MTVIPKEYESEDQWHELRKRHIGSSDIEALMGVEKYNTPFALYHQKLGNIAHVDRSKSVEDRIFWGEHLEPAIAFGIAKMHGLQIRKVRSYYTNTAYPGLGASLDYMITLAEDGHDKLVPFEIKNVDGQVAFTDWTFNSGEEPRPPMQIFLQVQVQLMLTEAKYAYIGALFGGNRAELIKIEPHPALQSMIDKRVREFWQCVHDRKEPEWDAAADLKAAQEAWYADLHHETELDARTLSTLEHSKINGHIFTYYEGAQIVKSGEAMKEAAKMELLALAQHHGGIIADAGKFNCKQNQKAHRRNTLVYPRSDFCAEMAAALSKRSKG